jgi:hypothetical protein
MSMILLHKTNIDEIDKPIRTSFWAGSPDKRKYHFVRWKWICKPRKKGRMGLKVLYKFNISMMCKCWWKLENDNGPSQDFMRNKYLRGSGVFFAKHRPGGSPLWADTIQKEKIIVWEENAGWQWKDDQLLG